MSRATLLIQIIVRVVDCAQHVAACNALYLSSIWRSLYLYRTSSSTRSVLSLVQDSALHSGIDAKALSDRYNIDVLILSIMSWY